MKKILYLINLIFLVEFGCQNEDAISNLESNMMTTIEATSTSKNINSLSKSEIMVPLKGVIIEIGAGNPLDCFGIPYFAQYQDIEGHLTHLGNVEGGYANLLCHEEMEVRDGVPTIVVEVDGQFMAANGDVLNYVGELLVNIVEGMPVMSNWFSIIDGTGHWDGADGYFTLAFQPMDNGTLLVTVDGWITPPGKIK